MNAPLYKGNALQGQDLHRCAKCGSPAYLPANAPNTKLAYCKRCKAPKKTARRQEEEDLAAEFAVDDACRDEVGTGVRFSALTTGGHSKPKWGRDE